MRTDWTSRLGRMCAALFRSPPPGNYLADGTDRDADRRRIRSELYAIRVRFPDHA